MTEVSTGVPPRQRSRTKAGEQSATLTFSGAFLLIGLIVALLFLAILRINHGVFTYVMDDPYIHLALSDQIRHGHYGINAGYAAAPSSSILYPFLLALGSGTRIHPYLPLILNVISLFVAIEFVRRLSIHLRLSSDNFGTFVQAGFLVLMALCFSMIAVVFTGLEHSVHLAGVAATVYGVALFLDEERLPVWLPAVLVLTPLVRYEGLALSVGALLVLALRGRWRTAAGTFAAILFTVGGFSIFLVKQGLAPLPSSVLVKSGVAATGSGGMPGMGLLRSLEGNLEATIEDPVGLLLLLVGIAAATYCALETLPSGSKRWTSKALMSLLLTCLIAGHALAGQFGSFHRYEDYAVLGTALIGLYLTQDTIRGALADKKKRLLLAAASGLALLFAGFNYWRNATQVPIAANNIYEQQYQMHRFVDEYYRGPVGVNDLGLVSYRNPNFVLDLGGLASEKARALAASGAGPEAYQALVEGAGVHLLIVYDEWFPDKFPSAWVKVASMDLSRKRISPAESEVQFYATDPVTAATVREELAAFRSTLPPAVQLTIYGPASALSVPRTGNPGPLNERPRPSSRDRTISRT